jgi:hypothetical protein
MKNRELFLKDPLGWSLLNDGVSSNNTVDEATLRYELQTFVCQGEYHSGLRQILQGYLGAHGQEQRAAWVSGFYGSGKSHLVKVLRFLWTNYKFSDGSTARALATLPHDVTDLLKELDTVGKREAGLHSAGGTLKAGVGSVRLRLLGIVLPSVGLPEKLSVARLILDLRQDGKLEAVEKAIKAAGKEPVDEFGKLYTSKVLHEAYLASHPNLGEIKNVGEALRAQYPTKVDDITIDDMLSIIRRSIARPSGLPCTVIVLDEIQQFINNDANVALEVQEVVEACCKKLDGRVLFVGTGQSALTDTPSLQRLMGRFTIKVHLKDNDVEKVVRTVVLQKKEDKKPKIEELVTRQSGEITRQLKTTKIATRNEDDKAYVPDYPLLPVRRRFWEHVLHSTDPTGAAAQMRTQLRVTHEACKAVADQPLGAVVPADFLYDQVANDLVISGEMQRRFQEIIEEQKTKPDGVLRSRICALVFLINKLPREGADIGVRVNAEHLADLLTDDLGTSAIALREKVPPLVATLATEGVLMEVDGEYRLQTTEGAAWEAEYGKCRRAILNNDPKISSHRGQLLSKAIQTELAGVSVLHGSAKEKRKVVIHHGMEPPAGGDGVTVWVRDGFQESEAAILKEIQGRSVDEAVVHVLIPKSKSDELKNAIAAALAAEETLNFKGHPTSQEGKEARASMQSRQASESGKVDDHIATILRGARVYLSGGQALGMISLKESVQDAASQVLGRLYPKFHDADSANWPTVWKKAREGNPGALAAVAYQGDPDKHPVAAELIRFIGAGKKGSEITARYTAPPYGWPKDAVDATLATLMVSGHLGGRLQGQQVKLADLDQRKVGQVDYRVEHPVLTAMQKLRIKKLFQHGDHKFQPGDEAGAAPGFVAVLKSLAKAAGGDPPAPDSPHAPVVAELEGLTGNDLLFGLFEKADDLTARITEWKATAAKLAARSPEFQTAVRLIGYAMDKAKMKDHAAALDAIRANRTLLDEPDPVAPIIKAVGAALRADLAAASAHHASVLDAEMKKLGAHPAWAPLPEAKRAALLAANGIAPRPSPAAGSDTELLTALGECDLAAWGTLADALPTRCAQALAAAIKEAEPKAQHVHLPGATIRTKAELEAWLNAARTRIEQALDDGPVIL